MKIKKYKYLGQSKYKVSIDDEDYIIYEDIIIKNNILSKKEISSEELNNYLKENSYYEVLYKSIKYLSIKMRSKKELIKYLEKTYEKDIINKVIEELTKQGYLNEKNYIKAYINDSINLKNIGPYKIEKELIALDINNNLIKEELKVFSKDLEIDKINKIINKEIKTNKNKSLSMLKNKLQYNLINQGYTKEYVFECLNNVSINEEEIYKKEYDKLYNKLSRKYQGKELDYLIKNKLYQKGFKN